jgi:hypothetical protein
MQCQYCFFKISIWVPDVLSAATKNDPAFVFLSAFESPSLHDAVLTVWQKKQLLIFSKHCGFLAVSPVTHCKAMFPGQGGFLPGPTICDFEHPMTEVARIEMICHGRSDGANAPGAAGYRGGKSLRDERTGKLFDFRGRANLISDYVVSPDDFPLWLCDVGRLWNSIERRERRCDARLFREIVISLPHQISIKDGRDLVKTWTHQNIVQPYRVPCHISVHRERRVNAIHAHVAFPERSFENGAWSKKIRSFIRKSFLLTLRKSFEESVNVTLAKCGCAVRVDLRSNHTKQVDALDNANDERLSYEARTRAAAEFLRLEYYVAGKVPRHPEFRDNMQDHPCVKRSRDERLAAEKVAQEFLNLHLHDAVEIDRYLERKRQSRQRDMSDMKRRSMKRAALSANSKYEASRENDGSYKAIPSSESRADLKRTDACQRDKEEDAKLDPTPVDIENLRLQFLRRKLGREK